MRKLLYLLILLSAALCYYLTRPVVHTGAGPAPVPAYAAAAAAQEDPLTRLLPGIDVPRPLRLVYRAWHLKEITRSRIPAEDWVPLKRMSPWLPKALVSVEDKRFYSHHGIDPDGIFRAILMNIQADEVVEGGSTITQQVVKNNLLTSEQSLERKILEAGLALVVEIHYSKDEILEMYLNTTFLGAGATGVQQASETYYGLEPSQLSLSEAAALAGIPYASAALNPFENPEGCRERRNLVLERMNEQGMITEGEMREAQRQGLHLR